MDLFPPIPENLADQSVEELAAFVEASRAALAQVAADPESFVSDDVTAEDVLEAARATHEAVLAARAEIASRPPAELQVTPEQLGDEIAGLAAELAADPDDEDEIEEVEEPEVEAAAETEVPAEAEAPVVEVPEPVVAAAPAARRPARPARSAAAQPAPQPAADRLALVAAVEDGGIRLGQEVSDADVAEVMIRRRRSFGHIADGATENITLFRVDWSDRYGPERTLGQNPGLNEALIAATVDQGRMRDEIRRRVQESLVAAGGLCAPPTPYYQLMQISGAQRPVRASLPGFAADRGGILAASPATLASINEAVGIIEAADDANGGTFSVKSCQVIDCPPFLETDVGSIHHCLQFGNLGSRTFPELVTNWNQLVLAAHARLAETRLLDGIASASTAVSADNLGLGATSTIPSQILAAAAGFRSRHRMATDAVLQVLLPSWLPELLISDMYRSQFQRFEMNAADFVRILREANVEPTFYMDSATGAGQVFGTQTAGDLMPFPDTAVWYLYPAGSFLYLDGGTLELGIVRDSVLNATNDFQIFGETWENVAFVGIESLAVTSVVCDSGVVSSPDEVSCPIDYTINA